MRPWTLSGHFHESDGHDIINLNEALSGMRMDVTFIAFEDICAGDLNNYQVLINAGRSGDAWSGGAAWKDEKIIAKITEWVHAGECL